MNRPNNFIFLWHNNTELTNIVIGVNFYLSSTGRHNLLYKINDKNLPLNIV